MYRFLGISDEKTTCECCGKTNLKRTVALDTETGVVFYGCDCAAKTLKNRGEKVTVSSISVELDAIAYAQKWIGKCDLNKLATAVWNKFGFMTCVKNNTLYIGNFAEIKGS